MHKVHKVQQVVVADLMSLSPLLHHPHQMLVIFGGKVIQVNFSSIMMIVVDHHQRSGSRLMVDLTLLLFPTVHHLHQMLVTFGGIVIVEN